MNLLQLLFPLAVVVVGSFSPIQAFSTVSPRVSFLPQHATNSPPRLAPSTRTTTTTTTASSSGLAMSSSSSSSTTTPPLQQTVAQLKRVLEREYLTFFNPMETDYYSPTVTFDDPMTSLSGVQAYQGNVDMLASRTLLGSLLFSDASIALHSVTGGEVSSTDGSISNIISRWTLRFTFKVLPWAPTARFSGISIYQVQSTSTSSSSSSNNNNKGVQITKQTDYWDSINLQTDGSGNYQKVEKSIAIQDFINQLKPKNFAAPPAGLELPFELLRRGNGYEVRRYPSYSAVQINYDRRDEAFSALGVFAKGMTPLAPAILKVVENDDKTKTMMWPLEFAPPGQGMATVPLKAVEQLQQNEVQWNKWNCQVQVVPSRVVAVGRFSDASVEPVVRKADRLLRDACQRDGLQIPKSSEGTVQFAQYDAIYSMGERRGEVWMELEDGGHPW